MFTSSLFLAGLFSSIFAGHITRHFGRKVGGPALVQFEARGCVHLRVVAQRAAPSLMCERAASDCSE